MDGEYWKHVPRDCPLCGANDAQRVVEWTFDSKATGVSRLRLGRCRSCRMIYAVNCDEVDMTGRKYVEWRPESDVDMATPAKIAYSRRLFVRLSKYLEPRSRIFDFGSGYCVFLRVAREAGHEVAGLNPCKHVADWCRRNLDIDVADVFGSGYSTDRPFDFAFSDQVFEHVERPLDDLRMIRSILKPGGLAFINVPNWNTYMRLQRGVDYMKDSTHFNYFTTKTLSEMCRLTGFEVEETALNVASGIVKRPLKAVLNRLRIGDCSVLLRVPGASHPPMERGIPPRPR